MKDIAIAICCACVGLIMLVTLGDRFAKKRSSHMVVSASESYPRPSARLRTETAIERPESPLPSSDYAQSCASFDPVAHPEQVLDILDYASKTTGTPIDVLFAVWMNETGVVYGSGGSDRCPVAEQLEIRCKVGGSCTHEAALESLTKRFNWNAEGMLCSCGTATMDVNTHNFGGCCGPFQFSPGEVLKDAAALDLDPMTYCGGAVIAGFDLHRRQQKYGSWELAIQRYYGADVGGIYYLHAYKHWQEIKPYLEDADHPERLRAFLARTADQRIGWSRKNQQINASLVSDN